MAHVFISYSKKNRDYARKLADHLLANGFDVWIDDRIDFGSNWEREIFKAVDGCEAIIVLMTPESYESIWVQRERQYAEIRRKQAFPLLLDGEAFPFYVVIQYYDVRGEKLPETNFLERLETFVPRRATSGQDVAAAPQQQAKVKFETSQIEKADVPAAAASQQPRAQRVQRRSRGLFVFAAAVLIVALMVVVVATMNPQLLVGFSPTPTPTLLGGGHGQIVFVSDEDENNEIYLVDADGGNRRNLTNDPAEDTDPAWSPDGTQIAFSSDRADGNGRIFIMNADGTDVHQLALEVKLAGWDPAWSPDGTQIAFTAYGNNSVEIFVVGSNGGEPRAVTENSFNDGYVSWSPDGTQIVFVSEPDGNEDLYIVDADWENPPRPLTNNSEDENNPTWSPDGMRIAFQTSADHEYVQICLISVDGDNPDCITSDPDDATEPAWSPDGTQIVFASYRDSNSGKELYVMDADGSNIRRLTNTTTDERFPAWDS